MAWLTGGLCPCTAHAETLRIATYNTELSRDGPGLLLADILKGDDPQVTAVVEVMVHAAPDIVLLQDIDYDYDGHALTALAEALAARGQPYPFRYAPRPNTGMETGHDLDRDGRLGEAEDMQGFGAYAGQGGMALLSRLPIDLSATRDFSAFPWTDLPGATLPEEDGVPYPSSEALSVLRLANVGLWDVGVELPGGGLLHLLAFDNQTPVFDGPEDFNGLRNADQLRFWTHLLDGALPMAAPDGPFVLLGDANLDPVDGEGRRDVLQALLNDPRLQDPTPVSDGGAAAANPDHDGDPGLDTADWRDPAPGNLRVDYVLPSVGIEVLDAGVIWPAPGTTLAETVATASRHHLVWIDIALP